MPKSPEHSPDMRPHGNEQGHGAELRPQSSGPSEDQTKNVGSAAVSQTVEKPSD